MIIRRTILKQELAVKLFPSSLNVESAMQLLRKEIRETPNLKQRLYETVSRTQTHYFTHKQLEIILEHFCITPKEFEQL
jgi:tRNA C32,U32 (ribose-2'-O)-methylase TrmJ